MRAKSALLCALVLAAVSTAACLFLLAPQPAVPPAADTEPSQPPVAAPPEPDRVDEMLAEMTLARKVAQLFWVRCPETGGAACAAQYGPAGFVLFARDFADRTAEQVAQTVQSYQDAADIPLLIGTDEEGGTVVRASRTLREQPFASPQRVYAAGGLEAVAADTAEKDQFLRALGVNVNLAPVADVSTSADDFMYARTIGQDAAGTADYVRTVVRTMEQDGMGSVLKHFPGYGPNGDTHTDRIVDTRPAAAFYDSDFVPFAAGIEQGADAVLVSHNTVQAFDAALPASLSPKVHQILREELDFDGVIVTDDLSMDAVGLAVDSGQAAVLAVQAGNDLLLSSDFVTQYEAVLAAVQSGEIAVQTVDDAVRRVLQWKLDLGLLEEAQ